MKGDPQEQKEEALKRRMPPRQRRIQHIRDKRGIPMPTLTLWRKQSFDQGAMDSRLTGLMVFFGRKIPKGA
jgi:hypothetical protein